LNLNGSFSFSPAFQYKILILLQISVLFDHVRRFLLTVAEDMIFKILMPSRNTDVHDAFADYNVDRRDTDISLPRRLFLPQRRVRRGLVPLSQELIVVDISLA
jgi:hypothetical protein